MGCNCGTSSCRGCKDIKVILPSALGISSAVDNGGSVTITYTDGTTFTFNTATPAQDDWVELEVGDLVTGPTWAGTATLNAFTDMSLMYKVVDEYSALFKCHAIVNVDINNADDSVNFSMALGPLTSGNTVFSGTKLLSTYHTTDSINIWSPVSVVTTTAVDVARYTVGRAYASHLPSPNGLIAVGNTNMQLPEGTYDIEIDFELTCKLV